MNNYGMTVGEVLRGGRLFRSEGCVLFMLHVPWLTQPTNENLNKNIFQQNTSYCAVHFSSIPTVHTTLTRTESLYHFPQHIHIRSHAQASAFAHATSSQTILPRTLIIWVDGFASGRHPSAGAITFPSPLDNQRKEFVTITPATMPATPSASPCVKPSGKRMH